DKLECGLVQSSGRAALPSGPVVLAQRPFDAQQPLGRVRVVGRMRPRVVFEARRMVEVETRRALQRWLSVRVRVHFPAILAGHGCRGHSASTVLPRARYTT